MKRFQFRLDTVLELRRKREESERRRLARKKGEIQDALNHLRELEESLRRHQSGEKEKRANASDVVSLRLSVAYRHHLKSELLSSGKRLQELQRQQAEITTALVEARRNVRALELLRERRYEQWRREYRSEEQRTTDEISQRLSPVTALRRTGAGRDER